MAIELKDCPMCGCAAGFVKHAAGMPGTFGYDTSKGERHGSSVFTAEQIHQIRKMRADGKSLTHIAKAFGAKTHWHISLIVRRKLWKEI